MPIVNCGGNKITIDAVLSDSSENPVQNKVIKSALDGKQETLVSGTNIKTVNNTTLLGSGNLAVQDVLVSGTNIKTINGTSILGSGDIVTASLKSGTGTIATSGWSATTGGYTASLSITGITADNLVIFPEVLGYPGMRATAQASGTITVFCDVEPSESVSITVFYSD